MPETTKEDAPLNLLEKYAFKRRMSKSDWYTLSIGLFAVVFFVFILP